MANPRPRDGVPNAAEYGLYRAYLAQQGVPQSWILDVWGNGTVAGRSRGELAEQLRAAFKASPKG